MPKKHKKHRKIKISEIMKVLKIPHLKKTAAILGVGFTAGAVTGACIKGWIMKTYYEKKYQRDFALHCNDCGGECEECDDSDECNWAEFADLLRNVAHEYCECEGNCNECAKAKKESGPAEGQNTENTGGSDSDATDKT